MPGPQGRPTAGEDRVLSRQTWQGAHGAPPALGHAGEGGGGPPSSAQGRLGRFYSSASARLSQPRTGMGSTGSPSGYGQPSTPPTQGTTLTGAGTTGDMYGSRWPGEPRHDFRQQESQGFSPHPGAARRDVRDGLSAGDRWRERHPEYADFDRELRGRDFDATSPRTLGYGGGGALPSVDVRDREFRGGDNVRGTGGVWSDVDRQRGFYPDRGAGNDREERTPVGLDRTQKVSPSRWTREPLTAREVMTRNPKAVRQTGSLRDVAGVMKDENCGVVPVVDDGGRLVGVITDRDIVIRAFAEGRNPLECRLTDVMTDDVECVTPDESVHDVVELMGKKQIRRVPVVDRDDRLLGIIAMGDIATRADFDEELQDALERISSRRSFWSRIFG